MLLDMLPDNNNFSQKYQKNCKLKNKLTTGKMYPPIKHMVLKVHFKAKA